MVKISSFTSQSPSLTSYFPFIDPSSPVATRNKKCDLESIFDLWNEQTNLDSFVKEDEPHFFSANQGTTVVELTEANNILVPGANGNYFRLLLTQSDSILRPPFPLRTGPYLIAIKQDNVGGHQISFDAAYKFPADFETNIVTTPGGESVVSCVYTGWSLYSYIARF